MLTEIEDDVSFVDIELTQEPFKVVLEYIGEGISGDYNPSNEEDVPLLRFSCFVKNLCDDTNNINPDWQEISDASYCTQLSVNTPRHILFNAVGVILENLVDSYDSGRVKRVVESMSWLCADDFNSTNQQ